MHTSHAQEHRARLSAKTCQAGRFSALALCLLAGLCGTVWFSQSLRPASANFQMIRVAPDKLLAGTVGTPYQAELRASGGGSSVYVFSLEEAARECLPAGLSLENGTPDEVAVLRGTPQEAGIFSFTVKVVSPPAFALRHRFTVLIRARADCGTLAPIEDIPCNPRLVVGVPYSETFNALGTGGAPYQFEVEQRISERLPKGLELVPGPRADQVTLRGVPAEAGKFRFHLRVEDANGCYGVLCHDYEVRTAPECALGLLPANLSAVQSVEGDPLALRFTPDNGASPYTFRLDNRTGERLPQGLLLNFTANATHATLSGTPREAGTFHFTIAATDKNGCETTNTYTLKVRSRPVPDTLPCAVVSLEPEVLANSTLTLGATFGQTFTARQGTAPFTFSAEQLPPGLQLEPPGSQRDQIMLSGAPAQAGSWPFTLKATDKNGCVGTGSYVLNVRSLPACPVVSFLPRELHGGIVGNNYPAQTIIPQPSNLSYNLTVTGGALPPGFVLNGSVLQGTPAQAGAFKFTLTAHSGACSGAQEYEVLIAGPLICPPNLTQTLSPGASEAVVNFPLPAAPPGNIVSCTPASGSTFRRGTTTVNCVSAGAAPSTTCSFTVTLTTCAVSCPAPVTAPLPAGQCATTVSYAAPVVNGACGAATCTPPSGSSFTAGVTTVTCTAPDGEGGNSTCSFTVTVNDTQPPTFTCPTSLTRAADQNQCTASVNYATPAVLDNCPGATVSCSPASGTTFPLGVTTVTCTATDAAQNKTTCAFTVTVNDTQAPTLVCPDNVIKAAEPNLCTAVVTYANATARDNCAGVATPVCTPPSGATFALGVTTVTCSVRDAAQNPATCSFTVTVNDAQAPVIACPPNQRVVASGPAAVSYTLPTVTDNCAHPTVSCNPPAGASFPLGISTVNCTAGDAANNRATCSFTITVTSCGITPPAPVTVNAAAGQCAAVVNYPAPGTQGSCGTVTCAPASGSSFPVGVTTVTCNVTDAGGVASSTSFTVTVNDTQAPVIVCPPAQQVVASGPSTVNYPPPVVTDNCANPPVNCVPPAHATFPLGVTTVTCTATDRSGNTALCRFPVTVTTCGLTCPAPVSINAAAGQCSAVVNYPAPATGATCGAVTCTPAAGSSFAVGVTTVTCTASDAGGISSSCSFTVTVNDTQAPVPSCPADVVRANEPGQCQAVVTYPAPPVTDNCPGATISCMPASDTAFLVGVTTVNCTARDAAGNTAACSFTVTVNDTEAPKLSCPASQSVNSNVPMPVNYPLPTVTDNCPGVKPVVCTPPPGATFALGTTTVNCTVSDAANNTANCSFAVTVNACTLTCPAPITVNTAPGQCAAVVTYPAPTTSGPCDTVTCTPPAGATFALGATTVTCSTAGGASTCSFMVRVNDAQPPVLTCPPNQSVTSASPATVIYALSTVSDNCAGVGVPVCTPPSGATFAVGMTTVNCSVSDAANNTANCSFNVTVSPCAVGCTAPVSVNASPGQCSAVVNYPAPTTSAACGTVTCAPASGSSFPVGVTTVTCNASSSGIVSTCNFTVTVNDTQAPTLVCPPARSVNSATPVPVSYPLPNVTDNCPGVKTPVCAPPSGATFAVGTTTVTCMAADAANNTASCSFVVQVGLCMVSACPAPVTVEVAAGACNVVVNYLPPSASGGCTVMCTPPPGTTFAVGTTTVNCTISDSVGTVSVCNFPVRVLDTQRPVIACPPTQRVIASGPVSVSYPAPAVTDNCPNPIVTCDPPSGAIFALGSRTVTCTASDASGNQALCRFNVEVTTCTLTPPPSPTVTLAEGQCAAVVNYSAPVTSGCGPVRCSPAAGTTFTRGVTTVTCATEDANGLASARSFTVTVTDLEAPKLLCPANRTVNSTVPVPVTYALPTATDNCPGVQPVVCTPASGTTFPVGTTTVNCTVSDAASNPASCSFVVTVGACTRTCPTPIMVNTEPGLCGALVNYSAPTTSSPCEAVTCTPSSGSVFPLGDTTVTCRTENGAAACSFTVTVTDQQKPVLTCPANISLSGSAPTVVNYDLPAVSDNCPGVRTPVCTPASGTAFPVGETSVKCMVADAANNVAECSFNVTVGTCPLAVTGAPLNFEGPVTARLTPNAQPAERSLTITNSKCGTVSFGLALQRIDNNPRVTDKNDGRKVNAAANGERSLEANDRRPFYLWQEGTNPRLVRLCDPTQTAQTDSTCDSLTLAAGASLTLRVYFDPLIPARTSGASTATLTAAQVLPLDLSSQLLLKPSANSVLPNNQALSTLTARLAPQLRFVHPCDPARDPAQTPVVTLTRAGNEFAVTTTIYDVAQPAASRNLQRVRFELLEGPAATVPVYSYEATTELTEVIRNTPLHPGQSFAFIQRFSGAATYPEVTHVRVTLNGDSNLSTVSGETGCPASFSAGPGPDDPAPLSLPDVELAPLTRAPRPTSNDSRRRR